MAALRHVKLMAQHALPLTELASVIRSKNAGPLCVTLDLFFRDQEAYERAAQSEALKLSTIAARYGLLSSQIKRFDLPEILAIKLSMPRTVCAGHPGDGDLYGAQQHAPLLSVRV